jgi:signal peptidase I
MSDVHDPEATQPGWQRWLNQFCENWIFAFIIAMAIRHFCIEAFVIPTASMEPMLYGDPGFMKGDHVVVDKLFSRFSGVNRWDVTVFQFPLPEVESRSGRDARPATDAKGERIDHPLVRPLMCRNFVKRAVVVPGDTFYFSGGNLYLKRDDGSFAAAHKPEQVQAAVWQDIWIHGDQPGYLPWAGEGGASVADAAGTWTYVGSAEGRAAFTQPLRNLYLKPAKVRVADILRPADTEIVDCAMTRPLFTFRGREGNVWDLDRWAVSRLTSADLDSDRHGTTLNGIMDEWVGDVRLAGIVTRLEGTVEIAFDQGAAHTYRCRIDAAGWKMFADGQEVGAGAATLSGRSLAVGIIDDQFELRLDGTLAWQHEIPASDPGRERVRLALAGSGTLALSSARAQRDLHYSSRGFLANELEERKAMEAQLARAGGDDESYATMTRNLALLRSMRESMRPGTLSPRQAVERWGYSPETAITAPADGYLLLGDNSPHSWDSRMWGWVPGQNIRGRALAVFLPWSRWRVVK